MTKYGKVWGETKPLIQTPTVEIHHISIDPKTRCSEHKHNFKWNAFYVIKGKLEIHVKKNNYDLVDITTVVAGNLTTVKPGEFHWFLNATDEEVEALEIYYAEPLTEDIVRKNCGGKIDGTTADKNS